MVAAGTELPRQIRVSGGGTASPLWRQILADILGSEIATVSTSEGAAYGAAILAGVGAGWYSNVDEACDALVRAQPAAEPGPSVDKYQEQYARYRELYPALAPTFHQL
jgi:xylulokinase